MCGESYRGPKAGYRFEAKAEYRDKVWRAFAENLVGVKPQSAVAVFLPGPEGLEIPVALRHGFRQKNLIAVDENPALLATAKWRKKYPNVRVMGGKVSRVFARLRAEGITPHAVNLDFCNALSNELIDELGAVRVASGGVLALTVQKGREGKAMHAMAARLNTEWPVKGWPHRLSVPLSVVRVNEHIRPLLHGEYKSGASHVHMVYGVVAVADKKTVIQEFGKIMAQYDPLSRLVNKAYRLAWRAKDRPLSDHRFNALRRRYIELNCELEAMELRHDEFLREQVPKVVVLLSELSGEYGKAKMSRDIQPNSKWTGRLSHDVWWKGERRARAFADEIRRWLRWIQ